MTDPKSIDPPTAKSDSDSGNISPLRDPGRWEEVEGFRHTFLIHFTQPNDAAALRQVARLLYDCALEVAGGWPRSRLLPAVEQVMAGAAECRFLEGFFGMVAREGEAASLAREEIRISQLAIGYAAAAGALAAQIERDLAGGAGEEPRVGR